MSKSVFIVGNPTLQAVRDDLLAGLRSVGAETTWLRDWSELSPNNPDLPRMNVLLGPGSCPAFEMVVKAAPLHAAVAVGSGTEGLDRNVAKALSIIIANGGNPENSESMAEATILLMLALLYRLRECEAAMTPGASTHGKIIARSLRGRTIGIIGFGKIARAMVHKLAAWEARILVYSPHLDASVLPPGVQATDFETLVATSELISLHVALNSDTRNLISRDVLRRMKRGALLVNTARGGVIDEAALIEALEDRHLAGAALDVFETEPLPADNPLRQAPNLILTPHRIGHTKDSMDGLVRTAIENVRRVIRGEEPLYTCNPDVLGAWRAKWFASGHAS